MIGHGIRGTLSTVLNQNPPLCPGMTDIGIVHLYQSTLWRFSHDNQARLSRRRYWDTWEAARARLRARPCVQPHHVLPRRRLYAHLGRSAHSPKQAGSDFQVLSSEENCQRTFPCNQANSYQYAWLLLRSAVVPRLPAVPILSRTNASRPRPRVRWATRPSKSILSAAAPRALTPM